MAFLVNDMDFSAWSKETNGLYDAESINHFVDQWKSNKYQFDFKTSGSTGKPKAIVLNRDVLIESATQTCSKFGVTQNHSIFMCLPMRYVAGKMMLIRALVSNCNLQVVNPNIESILSYSGNAQLAAFTPYQAQNILEQSALFFNRFKHVIIGGGVVNSDLANKLKELKPSFWATYGMTETATHVALNNIKEDEYGVFTALPNCQFKTAANMRLIISSKARNIENLLTNDVVELLSATKFIWKGRFDSVVNSGGIKIQPEELEAILSSQISQRFFLAGLPDKQLGEKLVLVIEGKELNNPTDFSQLEAYKRPKQVFWIENFKVTETGKVDKLATLNLLGYTA